MKKYLIGAAILLVIIALVATPVYLTKRKKAQAEKAKDKVGAKPKPSNGNALGEETEEIPEPEETED